MEFLRECMDIQKYLLILMHICGGAPPRGTEVLHLQIQNSQFHPRSFYVDYSAISLCYLYNKTGDKPTWRFLPLQISLLLVYYLVLIRPAALYFAGELQLWVSTGSPCQFAISFLTGKVQSIQDYRRDFQDFFKIHGM